MRNNLSAIRAFNQDIWRFLFIWAMVGFGYFGILTVLLNLYLLRLGYGPEFIGLLNGAGQVAWALSALPASWISTRLGMRNAVALANYATALGLLLFIAAGWLPGDLRQAGLFASWLLIWVAVANTTVNSLPYMTAVTPAELRGHVLAVQQAVMGLMAFFGGMAAGFLPALLGGMLGVSLDRPEPYGLALLLSPLSYLAAGWVFSRARTVERVESAGNGASRTPAPLGLFIFLALLVFFQSIGEGSARAFFNVYLDTELGSSTAQIGSMMGLAQLLPVGMAMLTPALIARRGVVGMQILTLLLSAFFLALLAAVPQWAVASMGYMGVIAMASVIATGRAIFSQEMVAERWRATTSALTIIGLALGWAVAPVVGGLLVERIGFRGIFLGGVGTALVAVLFLAAYARATRPQTTAEVQSVPVTGEGSD